VKVLYLTKDLELIKKQLYEGLVLRMQDLRVEDLLDDINTDVMTPAWVCFDYKPEDIAVNAYAGLMHNGERVFKPRALLDGRYDVIVSGYRKGTGSSRETAAQCERFCGIRTVIAASFAPIHEKNNINLGQLMGNHDQLLRMEAGEQVSVDEFCAHLDPISQQIIKAGGLFRFTPSPLVGEGDFDSSKSGEGLASQATLVEHILGAPAGQTIFREVNGGYSHEFTSAQVHEFLKQEFGPDYKIQQPERFAVFEDHLIYAHGVARMAPFAAKIQKLADMQREFQKHTGVRDYLSKEGVSPGICHEVAREDFVNPGDLILATDSHTCMAGGLGAFGYGVGTTEYAALLHAGKALVTVPESIRFDLVGELSPACTAKDLMLQILDTVVKQELTLNRVMEFGGPGLKSISADERATLCNMATECAARSGICEVDEVTLDWLAKHRPSPDFAEAKSPSSKRRGHKNAIYAGGRHEINLNQVSPRVAKPGDPTYGALISDLGDIPIDIAYAGSCTAGKYDDMAYYARVVQCYVNKGQKVHPNVKFYLQFGSQSVKDWVIHKGWLDLFKQAGVILLEPGCGACIGCGPGVSESAEQVTISAINRNFSGRSGPGKLYLASPLTVAASAFAGKIIAYEPN
jgi:3-isopropylmalate/(R)-2-methylmalate dehydratase large subunit